MTTICRSLYNCSPEPVSNVTINQTTYSTQFGDNEMLWYQDTLSLLGGGKQLTLPHAPMLLGSVMVVVDGAAQRYGIDFSLSGVAGNIITFITAPNSSNILVSFPYLSGATGTGVLTVGASVIWMGDNDDAVIPTGYLLMDGRGYSRTTYAALYAVVGDNYGVDEEEDLFLTTPVSNTFYVNNQLVTKFSIIRY